MVKAAWAFLTCVILYLGLSLILPAALPWADALLLTAIIQVVAILFPALVCAYSLGKDTAYIRKPPLRDVMITLLIAFGMIWVSAYCNLISYFLLDRLGLQIPPSNIPETGVSRLWLGLIVIVAMPALGEELMFRGVLLGGSRHRGYAAVAVSAVLFALMHVQPQNLVALIIMGAVLGIIAYRTQSVALCMVLHAANNLVPLLLTALLNANPLLSEASSPNDAMSAMQQSGAAFFIAMGFYHVMAVGSAVMVFVLIRQLRSPRREMPQQARPWPAPIWIAFTLLIGVNALAFVRMLGS